MDLATLRRLHRAHLETIPFENLDIQMGRPIELDPASLQAALVARRRGGYCFQQNGLFQLALHALGVTTRMRAARVRRDAAAPIPPRTHLVLIAHVDADEWLLDVGFGGDGIVEPVPLHERPVDQDGWTYRVIREGAEHVLQRARADGWDDLYAFGDEDAAPIDCVVANWFTSTHPDSRFVRTLTAQRMAGKVRHVLRNLSYSVAVNGGAWQTRTLSRDELVPMLRDVFGIDIPDATRFRALDADTSTSSTSSTPFTSSTSST